jgi:hypothetical protein
MGDVLDSLSRIEVGREVKFDVFLSELPGDPRMAGVGARAVIDRIGKASSVVTKSLEYSFTCI